MIRLVKGKDNSVELNVQASINIEGFSALLIVKDVEKTIPDLVDSPSSLEFTSEEIASLPEGKTFATLYVMNSDGDVYMRLLPEVLVVGSDGYSVNNNNNSLPITIVAKVGIVDTPSGGEEYVKKSDFEGIGDAKASVNSCQSVINQVLGGIRK